MKTRVALALAVLAGTAVAAQAQELVTYSWSFVEVEANTTILATGPNAGNGVIDPGEGAELRLSVSFTPAVGTAVSYNPPPGTGSALVGGLASLSFRLDASANHGGTFHNINRLGAFTLGNAGTISANGIDNANNGQFVLPGMTANPANPVNNIWRVRWTPTDYTNRVVQFTTAKASATPGTGAALYLDYNNDPNDPAYITVFVDAAFGGANITVVPAPSSLALLGLGGLMVARRRR